MPLKMLPEWTRKGLRFECTECGKCCTGSPGYTWLSEGEIEAIAEHLGLEIQEFADRFLRKVGSRWSLKENPKSFDCVFLKENKCAIYPVRPTQCRTYPWWLQNLTSEEAWSRAAKTCEGIGRGGVVPCETIEENVRRQMEAEA